MRKEIRGLTIEQHHAFRSAIDKGYFDTWEDNPRVWKHSFVGSFLWKWPSRSKTIDIICGIVGHRPEWEDLDDDTVRDIADEICNGRKQSTSRTMCAELKAVLNMNRRKIPSEDFMRTLSVSGEASQAVYLTEKEIDKFIRYRPKTETEQFVYRNFIVELLTGARLCDAIKLKTSNCDINTGTLSYVPDKTSGIIVTVPVNERRGLRKFLAMRCRDSVNLGSYNDIVRRICRESKINEVRTVNGETGEKWKFVSSHTARRSFATNLYLAGVSLEDVALMMGHGKNIDTTKRYICAERKITPSIMAYFKNSQDVE